MSFNNTLYKKQIEEKIKIAYSTTDTDILKELAADKSTLVRRAVAMNKSATREIIKILINDPTLNVKFIASQHYNCREQVKINKDDLKGCVICTRLEYENCPSSCNDRTKY